jgi:hypothetical protein
MKKNTLFIRCGYIIVIAALSFPLISGIGPRLKDYSRIESSITKILAGQSVDSEKRLEVVNFLNHRLNDEKLGADKINKERILNEISESKELSFSDKRQLFELVDRFTNLTVKMPDN